MAFTTWAAEYARAKDAFAEREWNSYFTSSVENHEEMRTTFSRLADITKFLEWLADKASSEAAGYDDGAIIMFVGGY